MTSEAKEVIRKVAGEAASAEKKDQETRQLVVFELDAEEYAVEIAEAKEIIKIPEVTPVPGAPEFISGIFNLRGKIVVVIDMERRFRLVREHPAVRKHALVIDVEGTLFGVAVDQVTEVARIPVGAIRPAPEAVSSKIHADYIKGIAVLQAPEGRSRLLILLDLAKVLQEKELFGFGDIVRDASLPAAP